MKTSKLLLTFVAMAGLALPALAQETGAQIQQRKANQQARIAQGVRSGQLTRGETRNLETKERALNREERNMRAANGGRLTRTDRAKLQRQQNHLSRQIAAKKNNDRVR